MEKRVTAMTTKTNENPIVRLQMKVKQVDEGIKLWLSKQPAAVEVAVASATNAVQGGVLGFLLGTIPTDMNSVKFPPNASTNPQAIAAFNQAQALAGGPWVQARNFAVVTGVNAGISCALKRVRGGVEDVKSSMAAAFGSGVAYTLVSSAADPNKLQNAVAAGVLFSLLQGGLYQVGQKFFKPSVGDAYYVKTRSMLTRLGLQNYEKNFRRGLLTDDTLPLLNDSALRDAHIPPGPRLLILDHIQRDPEVMWRGNQ